MLTDELRYKLLKRLEVEPQATQRELAGELGVSLGRVNYCLRALIDRGLVKAGNFRASRNKRAYLYKLTPAGLTEKALLAMRFLRLKEFERTRLVQEIEELRQDVAHDTDKWGTTTIPTKSSKGPSRS